MENIQPFDKAASTSTVTINTQNAQRVTLPDQTAFPSTELMTFGLSKREYFAAMAMQGLISGLAAHVEISKSTGTKLTYPTTDDAVSIADELINSLNK